MINMENQHYIVEKLEKKLATKGSWTMFLSKTKTYG